AQGVYPIPCYLMYERHIEMMSNSREFAEKTLMPRLNNTLPYQGFPANEKKALSNIVAKTLADNYDNFSSDKKQLGILMIVDLRLEAFSILDEKEKLGHDLFIAES